MIARGSTTSVTDRGPRMVDDSTIRIRSTSYLSTTQREVYPRAHSRTDGTALLDMKRRRDHHRGSPREKGEEREEAREEERGRRRDQRLRKLLYSHETRIMGKGLGLVSEEGQSIMSVFSFRRSMKDR